MKPWLVLLLLAPLAAGHVQDEYRIPYNVQIGGVGGGLFQGESLIYVTYDAVQPDSDEVDRLDRVSTLVTVTAFGPGSNIVAQAPTSSVIQSTGCAAPESVSTSTGVGTTRSHHTQTWRVTFDNAQADRDKCEFLIRVLNTGPTAFTMDIPVTVFNADGQEPELRESPNWASVIFLAFVMLALMRGWLLTGLAATIGFLGSFYAGFPLGLVSSFFFIVLALWLEAMSKGRLYSFFEKEKQA